MRANCASNSGRHCTADCRRASTFGQRVGHGHLRRRRRQRTVGRPMEQGVDPGHGHATVALQFGAAAFQVGQIDVGLEHVLLAGLRHLVLVLGDLAKLLQQRGRGPIHFRLPHRLVIVGQGHLGHLGQLQPGIAQLAAGGVGFRRGGGAPQRPLAGPGQLLRRLDHPAAVLLEPHAAGAHCEAEHRIFPRRHLRIALGGRLSRCGGGFQRRVARFHFRHQPLGRHFGLAGKRIVLRRGSEPRRRAGG